MAGPDYAPAHQDLKAQFLTLKPAQPAQQAFFRTAGLEGQLYQVGAETSGLCGRYRLTHKQDDLFIKVCSQGGETDSWLSLTPYLSKFGNCQPLRLLTYSNGYSLLACPWQSASDLHHAPAATLELGRSIGQLHHQLSQLPQNLQALIANKTRLREHFLGDIYRQVMQQQLIPQAHPELHRLLLNLPEFRPLSGKAQPLHGDLNPGNILNTGERLLFIDFEDTPHSYFPPLVELVFVIERHLLCKSDDINVPAAMTALLQGYRSQKTLPVIARGELLQTLLWHSTRSLLILCQLEQTGMKIPAGEWQKFIHLISHHQQNHKLLEKLEQLWPCD